MDGRIAYPQSNGMSPWEVFHNPHRIGTRQIRRDATRQGRVVPKSRDGTVRGGGVQAVKRRRARRRGEEPKASIIAAA